MCVLLHFNKAKPLKQNGGNNALIKTKLSRNVKKIWKKDGFLFI